MGVASAAPPKTDRTGRGVGGAGEAGGTGSPGGVGGFLERVGELKPPLAEHLRHLQDLRLGEGLLEMVVALDDDLGWSRLERPANREVIDRAVSETWGDEARWRRLRGERSRPAEPEPAARAAAPAAVAGPPAAPAGEAPDGDETSATEQAVLDIFDGMVERVDRGSTGRDPSNEEG